jgi:hypothetical protein
MNSPPRDGDQLVAPDMTFDQIDEIVEIESLVRRVR